MTDERCESCSKRREVVGVKLDGVDQEFRVCAMCAVLAIRTTGATSAELTFEVPE